jgi:hypothetical protein
MRKTKETRQIPQLKTNVVYQYELLLIFCPKYLIIGVKQNCSSTVGLKSFELENKSALQTCALQTFEL